VSLLMISIILEKLWLAARTEKASSRQRAGAEIPTALVIRATRAIVINEILFFVITVVCNQKAKQILPLLEIFKNRACNFYILSI